MSSSPVPQPHPGTPLGSAAQQFVTASVALVAAVEQVGARVEQLDAAQSVSASDVVNVRERIAAVDQRIAAVEQKPSDKTKWVQLVISVLAFVVSLVSAAYSIDLSRRTAILEAHNRTTDAEQLVLTLITEMADLERQTQSPAGQASTPSYLSARERYYADANKVEIYRGDHGFSGIDAKNFARLMRTVLSFQDVTHAQAFWGSLGSVTTSGLEDRLELALVDADYARVIRSKDEVTKAAARLRDCLQEPELTPSQQITAHLALAEMHAGVSFPDANSTDSARRELASALQILAKVKINQPDYGKDLEARTTTLNDSITKLEASEKQRLESLKKAKLEKQTKPPPAAPAVPRSPPQ